MERTSIRGKFFRRISKENSDYCIYLCSTADSAQFPPGIQQNGSYFTVCGTNLPAVESVEIEFFGQWIRNARYGVQFKADSCKFVPPSSEKGIRAFLSSKAFPGIGERTADAIVSAFGKETLTVIRKTPNKLLTVPGMTPSKVGALLTAYKKNASFSDITVFLAPYGIPADCIVSINDEFGADAVERIRQNPYAIQHIRGIGFRTCDRIARGLGVALNSYERLRGGILETISSHMAQTGDTCMRIETLEKSTLKLLNDGLTPPPVSPELFRTVARTLHNNHEIVFRSRQFVFTKEYDRAEDMSAAILRNMLKKETEAPEIQVTGELAQYRKSSSLMLSNSQADAVKMALQHRVSVITGGPGTGKTTILSAIIACYRKLYPEDAVTLLAPTGKAARRMAESTGEPASTIHSAIGYNESGGCNEPVPLPKGLIIVDEASMIDMLLMEKLLLSAGLHSHMVFIGDVEQLPSVSAGSVLQDMIASGVVPVAKLTEIFRQAAGSSVIENAQAINRGSADLHYDKNFRLIEVSDEAEALEAIKTTYKGEVSTYGVNNVALLSPLRRSQHGRFKVVADELNPVLQNVINPEGGNSCTLYNTVYRVRDRVLQWKNTQNSSNGDIGEITSIGNVDGDIAICIRWENGNSTVETRQSMADITLAYAISVHKSQGSEYKSVIIPVLSQQSCPLFQKSLLYTAVTRSSKCVTLIGERKAIESCIKRCDATKRVTLFCERLQAEG